MKNTTKNNISLKIYKSLQGNFYGEIELYNKEKQTVATILIKKLIKKRKRNYRIIKFKD